MLHARSDSVPSTVPQQSVEVLSRLACVRHALRLVDPFGGGPAPDAENEVLAAAWDRADESKRRRFDMRSGQLVGATSAGLDALVKQGQHNAEASKALVEQIRRELQDVAKVILD